MRFYLLQPGIYDINVNLPLITVEFLLDENIMHYRVERQSLHDICAWTGGLMFFVYVIVKLFIGKICEQNYVRKIIKRVFVYDDTYLGDMKAGGKVVSKTETQRSLNDLESP